MQALRRTVLECIYRHGIEDDELIGDLTEIIEKNGIQVYPVIFNILTHLTMPPEKAKESWDEIIEHRERMKQSLGRNVNLRTAICDYFCDIKKSLKNPKVVEIQIVEDKEFFAKYDYLTGLLSRCALDGSLAREIARSKRYENEMSLLFFDIDDFKKVNDTWGHAAGDETLKMVARAILEEIRSEDIAARYGGEEIVLILPKTGKGKALLAAERIRKKIEDLTILFHGTPIHVTVSGGLASYPMDADNIPDLLAYADKAMYQAKSFGKNNIVMYSGNRRRFIRIDFQKDIRIQQIGFSAPMDIVGSCRNISMNGILIESRKPLEMGAKVQVIIPLNDGDSPLIVIGTVVRVEMLCQNTYDIGISFFELGKTFKNEIAEYLMKEMNISNADALIVGDDGKKPKDQ